MLLLRIDWSAMFMPADGWSSIGEVVLRGSVVYFIILFYMRLLRRGMGQLNLTDFLFITLVADASQNAMAGEYQSITEGAVLVGVLFTWDYLMNWLGYHSVLVRQITTPKQVELIRNGRLMHENLKKELITDDELNAALRLQGVDTYRDVKLCCLEPDGNISVVRKEGKAS